MRLMYIYICFILLGLGSMTAHAQQASTDLKKVNASYESAAVVSQKVSYKSYANYADKTPYETLTGEIIRSKGNVYNKIGPVEIITTSTYTFSIDHEEKTMVLLPKSSAGSAMPTEVDYEALLAICSEVKYASLSSSSASYTMVFPSEEYEKVTVTFNTKSFYIQKLDLYYKTMETYAENEKTVTTKPKLEIVYSELKSRSDLTDSFFTYDTFLLKQSTNKYICKEPYTSYQFINQTSMK